jgi:threonylcarbamoyladenosine tRNA methylthiotransferase CDKAL1
MTDNKLKVCVKSFGCSANHAEAEIIKGQYNEHTESEQEADLIVLNICTVKGDKGALDEIKQVAKNHPNKKIAIAGCITPSIVEPIKKIAPDATLINTHHIDEFKNLAAARQDSLSYAQPIKILKPRVRMNPVVGIVPISSGCMDACSFCSTRLVKGKLFSFPIEQIVEEVKNCVNDGCKEIWITGQDTCCYGFDRKTNLAKLMQEVVKVEGDFLVRIGMGNPRHLPKFLDEFVEVMKNPKIFKFVHLPVQSGSDETLKHMRRGHDVATFVEIVNKLRSAISEITISTDIIVGHPGETHEDFEKTLKLVEDLRINNINTARFQPRPGTHAATMEGQVHGNESKERSRKLTEVYKKVSQEQNNKWINWEGHVIVDEKVKDGMGAHNYAYKQIILREELPIGSKVRVKIVKAAYSYLVGEVI